MYRGQPARHRPRNGGNGGNGHRNGRSNGNPNLRRLALARVRNRPQKQSRAGVYSVLAMLGVVGFLGVIGLFATAGVATGLSFLNKMESELPPVSDFEALDFAEPSTVYDRTGTIELARFQVERRNVVTYDEIPKVLLDATIAVEDRSFWDNEGYDPNAIVSAMIESLSGVRDRGASTITQQFVRARLLPQDVLEGDLWIRKIKEILQARNLTRAYPGDAGKERIMTAYLNQIYYGHQSYGIAAAAETYFGVTDLKLLTPSQAATLAGLPQAPDTYDLYKWARRDALGRLVVPTRSQAGERLPPPVERRNFILTALEQGHGHFIRLTEEQLEHSLNEPIILHEPQPIIFQAPHFVFYMKAQLDQLLGDRAPITRGGYKIITTIDMSYQALAEKYIEAGTIVPNMSEQDMQDAIDELGLEQDRRWIEGLHDKGLHNGALVTLDARTGQILAYVGSAGYYRDDIASSKFDPQYDVAGFAKRQPGSAWKPIVYAAGFDEGTITPGTLLLDVVTEFSPGYFPKDADLRERGPVLMRDALTYSLNIPTIRALDRIGIETVASLASTMGITFSRERQLIQAGLAGAIGTAETNMVELTSAYGALANRGVQMPARTILEVWDANGNLLDITDGGAPKQVLTEQSAWLITDVLKDSTDPVINSIFGPRLQVVNGVKDPLIPGSDRRPAAAKTGTASFMKDLTVFGYLAPPADPAAPHIVSSVWLGNSDNSSPNGGEFSILAADGPGRIWAAYLRELSRPWPIAQFPTPPAGIVAATIDAWSGGAPGPWTRDTRTEWFIAGTQPGGERQVDPPGILYRRMCGGWYVDIMQVEPLAPPKWLQADAGWMERARRGTGRRGENGGVTARLFGRDDWGGFIAPTDCSLAPTPRPVTPPPGPNPTPKPEETPQPTNAPEPPPPTAPPPT